MKRRAYILKVNLNAICFNPLTPSSDLFVNSSYINFFNTLSSRQVNYGNEENYQLGDMVLI